jgi:hypothetical protein
MICSSPKRFFMANFLIGKDWSSNLGATHDWLGGRRVAHVGQALFGYGQRGSRIVPNGRVAGEAWVFGTAGLGSSATPTGSLEALRSAFYRLCRVGAAKQSARTSCFPSPNEGGLPEASPALEFP